MGAVISNQKHLTPCDPKLAVSELSLVGTGDRQILTMKSETMGVKYPLHSQEPEGLIRLRGGGGGSSAGPSQA